MLQITDHTFLTDNEYWFGLDRIKSMTDSKNYNLTIYTERWTDDDYDGNHYHYKDLNLASDVSKVQIKMNCPCIQFFLGKIYSQLQHSGAGQCRELLQLPQGQALHHHRRGQRRFLGQELRPDTGRRILVWLLRAGQPHGTLLH